MKIAFLSSYKDEDDMAKNKFLHSFTLLARKTMVPFILRRRGHTRPLTIWEEPRTMFVGSTRQQGATDYDEEVKSIFV